MAPTPEDLMIGFLVLILLFFLASRYRPKWKGSGTAFGTARWAAESDLEKAQMFSRSGLVLGRTTRRRKLIHMKSYCHTMVCAPTGAGKGVSLVIPTLLQYRKLSVFIFDPKGELFLATAAIRRRRLGQKIIVIDPFNVVTRPGGSDRFNPLSALPRGSTLIDESRAAAESMVIRAEGGDRDPYWNNAAASLLTTMITATLLFMKPEQRNLDTVRDLMTDPELFKEVLKRLQDAGGLPARLANQLSKSMESDKAFADISSTANTHTSFIDSLSVAAIINSDSFSPDVLLRPGTTIYFILPVEQLESQRNFLRLVVSTLLRHVMRHGVRKGGECLFLLDEAAACSGLDALAQAFVLGRGKGIRLYTFWQTAEQAQTAFRKTPNLVGDNSDSRIFFGVNSYPTAELISKMLGNWTMVNSSANDGGSGSHSYGSTTQQTSYNDSWSHGRTHAEMARPLLAPAEILQLSGELLIAFVKHTPPILARRIKYYSDPVFRKRSWTITLLWWLLLWGVVALMAWGATAP